MKEVIENAAAEIKNSFYIQIIKAFGSLMLL